MTAVRTQPIRRATARETGADYYYRRHLSPDELIPAIGAGIGVGLLAFYVLRTLIQRTPLLPRAVTDATRVTRREELSRSRLQASTRS